MRNQPDGLTERVLQMLAAARTSPITREEVAVQLMLSLRRNLSYLSRRARRGHHTSYDERLEGDVEAIALAIVLLQGKERGALRDKETEERARQSTPQASSAR